MAERLQQQRGLSDTGVAPQQHHAAVDQPAAQHAIELGYASGIALFLARIHFPQILHLPRFRHGREPRPDFFGDDLHKGIPFVAMRTLALPFQGLAATLAAGISRFRFAHFEKRLSFLPFPRDCIYYKYHA
jgi:hypothetical protein